MKSGISATIATLALAMAFSSCTKERVQPSYDSDGGAVRIVPEIASAYTRSNPAAEGKETEFNSGDMIALLCGKRHVTFKLTGKGWTPTDNYYLRWGDSPVTYSAFYPATETSTAMGNFDLQSSQRTVERMAASDYMTCTVENAVKSEDGTLKLRMERQMAQVCLTLSGIESGSRVQGFRIWTSTGFTNGEPNADRMYVSPYTTVPEGGSIGTDGTKYTAIIVPGEADATKVFISFNYKGREITVNGVPETKAGFRYEMDLNVSSSIVSVGEPSVEPWEDGAGVIPGGDTEVVPLTPFFVKPEKSGKGNGSSWEDAFGMVEFLNYVKQNNSSQAESDAKAEKTDDRDFYFTGGTYTVVAVKIEYSKYPSRVTFRVNGGYSPDSRGTDISNRNIETYETIFDGEGTPATLTFGNQVETSFNGITFANILSVNMQGCFNIAAGGGDSRVNFTDCKFRKCTGTGPGTNAQSPVLMVKKGMARLDNVIFEECRAENGVRGLIRLGDDKSRVYLNGCRFTGCTWGGNGFGQLVHVGSYGSILCMHNVIFSGNDPNCSTQGVVNGAGGMLIASSTIAASNDKPAIRCESLAGAVIVNNIILQEQDQRAIDMSTTGRKLTSAGGNIIIGSINGEGFTASSSDDTYPNLAAASALEFSSYTGNGHIFYLIDGIWNGTTGFTKLTKEQVRETIRPYGNSRMGKITDQTGAVVYDGDKAGEDFLGWLDSIDAFDADCYGNARTGGFWPGAYQGR